MDHHEHEHEPVRPPAGAHIETRGPLPGRGEHPGHDDGHGHDHGTGHGHAHGHGHEVVPPDLPFRPVDPANAGRGLRAIVWDALPADAVPTGTLTQPVPGHVLANADGDVAALTAARMSQEFADAPHVIVAVQDGDLNPTTDSDVQAVLDQSGGGVVVFGVSYRVEVAETPVEAGHRAVQGESCPECGSAAAFEISRSEPDARGATPILVECGDCGAVWDSWA
ncbi:hypothetical protein [Actinotalea sp. Marseille-Q4924]|uniref:hypothetical protein n=1 Tax=Actinotalea sp. Marseille-Q4924 TaxID=2866571 RepID=UPI001CE4B1FA|nr:hypothetical protein [Actinotalea sp. Marseille-Q4924]